MPRVTVTGLQDTVAATSTIRAQWAAASGVADAIEASFTPANTVLTDGLLVGVRLFSTNGTATPTLNVDVLGAYPIQKSIAGILTFLAAGDLPVEAIFRWDQSSLVWIIVNPSDHATAWVSAAGTADVITANYLLPVLSGDLVDGFTVAFRASAANATTTPTFSPNTLTARVIKKLGGHALAVGDIFGANAEVILKYHVNATPWWELLNPATPADPTFGNLSKYLVADDTNGASSSSAQPLFPTAPSGLTVKVGTYAFKGFFRLTRASGTTSHTTGFNFALGTSSVTQISYSILANADDTGVLAAVDRFYGVDQTTTIFKGASTSGTEVIVVEVEGFVTFSIAGTFVPGIQFSAAPGAAFTVKAGSYFIMHPIPVTT